MKPAITLAAMLALGAPGAALAQQTTTGSVGCTAIVQAAANGTTARIAAANQTIQRPASLTTLSCLNNFFSGTGLNVVTNLLDPATLLQNVGSQICQAVNHPGSLCLRGTPLGGPTFPGTIWGWGGLGGGLSCPKLTFGGGGPPIGSIGIGTGGSGSGLYINGTITAPPGYELPANAQGTF